MQAQEVGGSRRKEAAPSGGGKRRAATRGALRSVRQATGPLAGVLAIGRQAEALRCSHKGRRRTKGRSLLAPGGPICSNARMLPQLL